MSDLGPQPEPEIEPGEPNPGGPDAIPEDGGRTVPDLSPDDNPAIEETPDPLKESVKGREDTSTQATRDESDDEPEQESPA